MTALEPETRRARRWPRRVIASACVLIALPAAVYAWAWASVDRSSIARAVVWMGANVDDRYRFPARTIAAGGAVRGLPSGGEMDLSSVSPVSRGGTEAFDRFLRQTDTIAFLVVDDDRLVFERYGQYIYIAPDAGTVIVRNGRDWGASNETWVGLFRAVADQRAHSS